MAKCKVCDDDGLHCNFCKKDEVSSSSSNALLCAAVGDEVEMTCAAITQGFNSGGPKLPPTVTGVIASPCKNGRIRVTRDGRKDPETYNIIFWKVLGT